MSTIDSNPSSIVPQHPDLGSPLSNLIADPALRTPIPESPKPVKDDHTSCDDEEDPSTGAPPTRTPRSARSPPNTAVSVPDKRRASIDTAVGVTMADIGVTVGGSVAYLAVGRKLRGYLAAFRAVRPLVVQILMLPPIKAYRSFKMISRLQRLTHVPYPPAPPTHGLEPLNYDSDRKLIENLKRYLKFAAGAYGETTLAEKDIQIVPREKRRRSVFGKLGDEPGLETYILSQFPKAELIYKREKPGFERPALMLFALAYKAEVVLTIQGSTCTQDWVTNLVCNPCFENGNHSGMRQSALNLDKEVREILVDYLKTRLQWKCTIVGHSLGGGTATLLAIRWIKLLPAEHRKQIHAYSFGCPCVASQAEAQMYRNQIFSIIFGRDLIARLSFGAVRDLLAQLHGLCSMARRKGDRSLADVHRLPEPDSPSKLTVSTSVDSPGFFEDDEDDDISIGSDDEVALLEQDALMPVLGEGEWNAASGNDGPQDGAYAPNMGGKNRRQQIRRDLTFAQENMTLPVPYRELRRLVRKRARELDERIKDLRVEKRRRRFSLACGSGRGVPALSTLTDEQRDNEFDMLKDAIGRVNRCSVSAESEQMMPAGSAILIIPKLHYVVAGVESPSLAKPNEGQCYLFRCEGINLVRYLQRAIWHTEAMKDHNISCYYQGLSPDDLVSLPLHSALLPPKEAKIASVENAAEAMATPMNKTDS